MQETKKEIRDLATQITKQQSFNYFTLDEAKKTVQSGEYKCTFDAATLLVYEHNMNSDDYNQLLDNERPFFKDMRYKDPERYKELSERRTLFQYLQNSKRPFREYHIKKNTRPDFVLSAPNSSDKYGIEVVKLTTERIENLLSLSASTFGENKSVMEIEEYARKHHRAYANKFHFYDLSGSTGISAGWMNITGNKKHYAEQLKRKYEKYRDQITLFKEFIVLAETDDIGITSEDDVIEVAENLKRICPEISNITIAIIWLDARSRMFISEIKY